MPKINSISTVSVPKLSDKLIGTSVDGTPSNQTNNFTLQEIKDLFYGPTPSTTNLQDVLDAGNSAVQNIYLTGTIEATNLEILNDSILKNLYLSERFYDKNNSSGTSGQYLTSTATGVEWSTLTISIPTLQQVLTAGNVSDKNIITTGNIQGNTITGTNLIANSNLRVIGTLADSSNSVGTNGQVLSSTVTGIDWVDLPSYSAVSPLIYNNVLKQFSIQQATGTQNGYLSSADWITFNGKQNAGNYITALTGEASASGPGSATITLNNLAVINKTLTGLSVSGGTITAADSIISAFGKLQNQINGVTAGLNYQGVWNAATNTPTLLSSVGSNGDYYVVDVAGNTNLNGISNWHVGDWAIFNGTSWQKIDNTDSVVSVNGQIGIVVLDTDDINEGTTNLYYTDTRARNSISSLATGLTYTAGTGIFSLSAGYSIPTIANQTDWTTAYNNSITSAAVTGTSTKTLTLTQQDGGTITTSWTDTGLTSVGVSMPAAFNVTNSPLTSNGTIAITGAGTSLEYIDGTGALQTFPILTGFVPYTGATQFVDLGYNSLSGSKLIINGPSAPQGGYLGFKQSTNVLAGEGSLTSIYAFGSNYLGFKFPQSPSGYRDFTFNVSTITPDVPGGRIYNMPDADGTLALTSDIPPLTGYVPYTGATQNVDLGEYELKAGQLTLDITPTGTAVVGTTQWNDAIGSSQTLLKGGSVLLKNGVDLVVRVVNKVTPNATLSKAAYQAVRVSGAQGQRLAVAYAQADGDPNSADTLGLVCETIPTNQEGFIITVGNLEGIDTTGALQGETWNDGDVLYLSPTVPGGLTNIKPNGSTGHIVVIGYVEYAHQNNGKIYVKIMNGWELDELHNVFIDNPLNNQGLFYTSTTQLWENKSIATALGYTPANAATTISTTAPLQGGGDLSANRTLSITQSNATTDGYLSSTDWSTFNSKQNAITLTTVGSSGPATLIGSTLNIPDYVTDLSGYVTLDTNQTITGLKTIVRSGDVLNFKIGNDNLYGLKLVYTQNEIVPSGEATWSFVNTFNNGSGVGIETTPISFFRGVLVTGERLLSTSVNSNLLDYYGNNPSGRYPIYAYNTGVQQFASSIIVGETAGVVNPVTGAIADLPSGVVANFNGRVIGSNAVNNDEFITLGQLSGFVPTSIQACGISGTTNLDSTHKEIYVGVVYNYNINDNSNFETGVLTLSWNSGTGVTAVTRAAQATVGTIAASFDAIVSGTDIVLRFVPTSPSDIWNVVLSKTPLLSCNGDEPLAEITTESGDSIETESGDILITE